MCNYIYIIVSIYIFNLRPETVANSSRIKWKYIHVEFSAVKINTINEIKITDK